MIYAKAIECFPLDSLKLSTEIVRTVSVVQFAIC